MNNFREWLSDNLRYFMLIFGILAVLVALFFGVRAISARISDDRQDDVLSMDSVVESVAGKTLAAVTGADSAAEAVLSAAEEPASEHPDGSQAGNEQRMLSIMFGRNTRFRSAGEHCREYCRGIGFISVLHCLICLGVDTFNMSCQTGIFRFWACCDLKDNRSRLTLNRLSELLVQVHIVVEDAGWFHGDRSFGVKPIGFLSRHRHIISKVGVIRQLRGASRRRGGSSTGLGGNSDIILRSKWRLLLFLPLSGILERPESLRKYDEKRERMQAIESPCRER